MPPNKRENAMEHVARGLRGILRFIHGPRRWRSRVVPQIPAPTAPRNPYPPRPHVADHRARHRRRRPRGRGTKRSSTCLICMEPFKSGSRVVCNTRRCSAAYHRHCIFKWQVCAAAQQPYVERSHLRNKCLQCTVGDLRSVYHARRIVVTTHEASAHHGAAPRGSRRSSPAENARRRR